MGVAPERPELTARKKIKAGRLRLQKSKERQKLAVKLDMNIFLFLDHLFVCFSLKVQLSRHNSPNRSMKPVASSLNSQQPIELRTKEVLTFSVNYTSFIACRSPGGHEEDNSTGPKVTVCFRPSESSSKQFQRGLAVIFHRLGLSQMSQPGLPIGS
jgi:hypothetical protein